MSISSRSRHDFGPSRVLLVCVYDTVLIQLTNQMLYQAFSVYGELQKVLIFGQGQVTKCFVQFMEVAAAEAAKKALDGTRLLTSFCKIQIFYSNLKDVDIKSRPNTNGIIFSTSTSSTSPAKPKRKSSDDFDMNTSFHQDISLAALSRAKTDQPNLSHAIRQLQAMDPQDDDEQETGTVDIDDKIRRVVEHIFEEEDVSCPQINFSASYSCRDMPVSSPVNSSTSSGHATSILSFSFSETLQIMEVYNLFSNYGNINKIILRKNSGAVEFTAIEFAKTAKEYLTNMVFFGNTLRLTYSKESIMNQIPGEYSQCIVFDQSFARFKPNKSISINPPSQVLHISSIKKEFCNQEKLRHFFEEAGRVEKVNVLTPNKERNMALVKFCTIEESLKAVALLHNRTFGGRKIQISFTKSKI